MRVVPDIDDKRIRSLVYGVLAASVGLALNALLIDVYEASKVAFVLWLVLGVTLGLARLYQKKPIVYLTEVKNIFFSIPSLLIALVVAGFIIFSKFLSNYFVGDDFTWLRWAADCKRILEETGLKQCGDILPTITHLFTNSEGFFYRPGTKMYFYLAYPIFELFPTPFHVVSLLLHISASILVFFLSKKFLKSTIWGFIAAFLFLILSVHAEAVYWISVTGHLIATNLILLAFLCYVYWRESKRVLLFITSLLAVFFSMFFHEFGTTGPLLLIAYDLLYGWRTLIRNPIRKWYYLLLLSPIVLYYVMRISANSVWFQGDYSYNLAKLPLNFMGNALGYLLISVVGPFILEPYTSVRVMAAQNLMLSGFLAFFVVMAVLAGLIINRRKIKTEPLKIILLSAIIFLVPLLPFLGLGNISPRYAYLGSVGVVILLVYLAARFMQSQKYSRVAYAVVAIVGVLFIYLHISQLNKINIDWEKAGNISNNALVGINVAYAQPGVLPVNPVFYFINVPIRYGDAWVFPVGLQDAIWFSFQGIALNVIQTLSEKEAAQESSRNPSVRVFKFEKSGSLLELNLPSPTPIINPYVN